MMADDETNAAMPWKRLGAAFGTSLAAGLAGWWVLGMSLSLPLWALAVVALLVPAFVVTTPRRADRPWVAMSVNDGVGFALLLAMYDAEIGLLTWLRAYLVLLGFSLLLLAGVSLLRGRLGAAIVSTLAMAWLAWPILLAGVRAEQAERLAAILVPIHPPMALNGLLRDLGAWTHQPASYRLMSLGQDVPYALPTSAWPCVFAHLSAAALLMGVAWVLQRRRPAATPAAASDEPDASFTPRP
jgi:hypothetical protein